ncbi:MAG: helix-turn-helix transcriptional regulator [Patulibacter sp.]
MSRLRFRNIDASPSDPVERWPYEGLVAAIERGAVSDWRRIIETITELPWGGAAANLDAYLAGADETGVTALMRRALHRSREAARTSETQAVAEQVRALIAASGLSRTEFAERAGTSPSRLSTYCTGKVTPSAALTLRFARISQAAQTTDE